MTPRTRPFLVLLAALALAITTLALTPTAARAEVGASMSGASARRDADCSDFSSQAAAQSYFLHHGGPRNDPDGLDADGDGVACESNPCPCSTAQGGDGGGGGSTGGGDAGPKLPPRKVDKARIVRVIDGDTVEVRYGGHQATIRMLGIDTPEVYGGTECGGPAASARLKRLLPERTRVTLVSDRTQDLKDRYGRQLRYVMKHGRTDMSKAQVTAGAAKVYVYGGNRFERYASYAKAQKRAKRHDRGLWGAC